MRLDASSPEVFLNASHGIGVVDGESKHWQRLPWNLYHCIIANSPEFSMSQLLKDIKKILNLKMTAKLIIHLRMTVKRDTIKGSRKESQFSVILSFFFWSDFVFSSQVSPWTMWTADCTSPTWEPTCYPMWNSDRKSTQTSGRVHSSLGTARSGAG